MSTPLYQECSRCAGTGAAHGRACCPACAGEGYVAVGLTLGQVEALRDDRDRLTVALDGVECGDFRRGWLAEAERIWADRDEDDAPGPELLVWVARVRELVRAMVDAHQVLDGRSAEVEEARRRLTTPDTPAVIPIRSRVFPALPPDPEEN